MQNKKFDLNFNKEGEVMLIENKIFIKKGNTKNIKKLEKQVMANSLLLSKELNDLIKIYNDKYIVFNKGEKYFTDTFEDGINLGLKKFGKNIGFVVHKLSNAPIFFSDLVKL